MKRKKLRKEYEKFTKTLITNNLTVSTMESCTGGFIAHLLTNADGASQTMKGAFVTYSNEAKVQQGVSEDVISQYGVYSIETAKAMAMACMKAYGANIGIGITGTIGNADKNNKDSKSGEVYIACAKLGGQTLSFKMDMINVKKQCNREKKKRMVAETVLEILKRLIETEASV